MVLEDDSEDDISLRQLIQLTVTTFHIDSAVAMSANDLFKVNNTADLFSYLINDAILSQVIDQAGITTTETDSETDETNTILEPMAYKRKVYSVLAVILRTTERTYVMTDDD